MKGEGGELKKVGANTERGRQQKTVVGLSQAIISMLIGTLSAGKGEPSPSQKGESHSRRKAPAEPKPGSPQESPREPPGESPIGKPARATH